MLNNLQRLICHKTQQTKPIKVRSLNRIGQLPERTASAIDHNIDITCVQEYRFLHRKNIEYQDTGNRLTFVMASAWKNSVNAAIGGVGMLIGPRTTKITK